MLSKRYESTKVDRRTWLHVPSGTHWSTSSDTHQVTNKAFKLCCLCKSDSASDLSCYIFQEEVEEEQLRIQEERDQFREELTKHSEHSKSNSLPKYVKEKSSSLQRYTQLGAHSEPLKDFSS